MAGKLESTLNNNNGGTQGYIVMWRLPEMTVPYDDIVTLANDVQWSTIYTPLPSRKRNAWERATNINRKISIPQYKMDEIKRKHGVEPVVRLHTEIVSNSAPRLVRHLVRTVSVPVVDDMAGKRELAEKQLSSETIAILEYFTETTTMRSTGDSELWDSEGFVNGSLKDVIDDITAEVIKQIGNASANDVRIKIREYLNDRNGILMSAGGAYFIPRADGVTEELKALKAYLEALGEYQEKKNQLRPQVVVLPVVRGMDGFDAVYDIAANAIDSFQTELQGLVDSLKPVLAGKRTENVANKLRGKATTDFLKLQSKIQQYREVLDDGLTALDHSLIIARTQIAKAASVTDYREPAKRTTTTQEQDPQDPQD